jgi:Na+-driven multidrug efflux pump
MYIFKIAWISVTAIVIFCIATYFFLEGIIQLWSQQQEQVFGNNNDCEEKNAKKEDNLSTKKPRVKSLDVFRG